MDHEVHVRDYLYVIKKRKGTALLFLILALLSGIFFTLHEDVLYKGTATLLIEKESPNVVDFKEVVSLDTSTTDYYQTQYKMLESRSLIRELIQQERLDDDPYLNKLKRSFLGDLASRLRQSFGWIERFFIERSLEDVFANHMLAVTPLRNSRLVEVSVYHPDPEKASSLAEALANLFIRRNLEMRFKIASQATGLITDQLAVLKDNVSIAERKLQNYKEVNQLVNLPSIREKDEFIQDAKLELMKIQAEEAKLAQRYLPAHPKRIHIASQLQALKQQIEAEEQKILDIGRVSIDYGEIERETQSARQIYEALLERLQETTSQAKTQASNIAIVDHASIPLRPYSPRPVLNLLIAVFIGTLGGILMTFLIEYFDSSIKIPDDVEKGLGLHLMGIVPKDASCRGNKKGKFLFLDTTEPSASVEAFRALRTALLFQSRKISGGRIILVSSPNPSEGKSTVSINLANAFRQNLLKVLLIDADLRKPSLHKTFEISPENGLSDFLEGKTDVRNAIRSQIADLGFDFMPGGTLSVHPTEILGLKKMAEMLAALKNEYDIIIIDSPPYLPVADVAVLSEYADIVLAVANYHKTDKRHFHSLRKRLNLSDSQLLGVVINQVSVREKDYYYHQYYYYGYGKK